VPPVVADTSVGGERPLPGVADGSGGVTVVPAGVAGGAADDAEIVVVPEEATTLVPVEATVVVAAAESADTGAGGGDEATTVEVASVAWPTAGGDAADELAEVIVTGAGGDSTLALPTAALTVAVAIIGGVGGGATSVPATGAGGCDTSIGDDADAETFGGGGDSFLVTLNQRNPVAEGVSAAAGFSGGAASAVGCDGAIDCGRSGGGAPIASSYVGSSAAFRFGFGRGRVT